MSGAFDRESKRDPSMVGVGPIGECGPFCRMTWNSAPGDWVTWTGRMDDAKHLVAHQIGPKSYSTRSVADLPATLKTRPPWLSARRLGLPSRCSYGRSDDGYGRGDTSPSRTFESDVWRGVGLFE